MLLVNLTTIWRVGVCHCFDTTNSTYMPTPPESLRKLFKLGHPGTVPPRDPIQSQDQRTSRNSLPFFPPNPFPWATEMFSLNINTPSWRPLSKHRGRGRALWRAETTRFRRAGHHCHSSTGGPSAKPRRSGSPPPIKKQFTTPAAHITTSHEPALRFSSAEQTPESATRQGLRAEG